MKFLKYLTLAAIAFVGIACQEDAKMQAKPIEEVTAPVLNTHSDIVIDANNLNSEVTFTWSAVDYGYQASVAYGVFAACGEQTVQLGESYSTSYTLTKEALNNTLVSEKGLALPTDATSEISMYVTANIGSGEAFLLTSNTITLNVTTIASSSGPWIRRPLYIAGNFQGWAPGAGPVLWETAEWSDVYTGLVYLGAAEGTGNFIADDATPMCHFKFCPNPNWTGNFGGDPNAFTTEGDPAHILAEEGLYWIKVTLDAEHTTGSVSLTPVQSISVIGTAVGGWETANDLIMDVAGMPAEGDADYDNLYYAAMQNQTWTAVMAGCQGGAFKYRLNQAWTDNWGGDLNHLTPGGADIVTDLTGDVRFSINFHGDVETLAKDDTNPSPISGSVELAE